MNVVWKSMTILPLADRIINCNKLPWKLGVRIDSRLIFALYT